MTSILPAHLSELERDLEQAAARIAEVEIPISVLWNPWECPLDVLPYLAWALSVDQWRSHWPEAVKRRVVAASLPLHRIKGTRPAVEQALAALGVVTELTEWFEADPPREPGTFELVAWANENLSASAGFLNQELYEQVRDAVINAKNTRSHFNFAVGAKFGPSPVGLGAAMTGLGALAHHGADAVQPPLDSAAGVAVAMAGRSAAVGQFGAGLKIDARPKSARLGVAGVCRGWAVIYRQMEATT